MCNSTSDNKVNDRLLSLGFVGSYRPNGQDIIFLLKKDNIKPTSVVEKERLIQLGQSHYSQMYSAETAPSEIHLKHYNEALKLGVRKLAIDVQKLSNSLKKRFIDQPIVLVSLIRGGVPLGVLLKNIISLSQPCYHYGISIIRDKGIDYGALKAVITEHGAENIVFVDGWIGKGAISKELTTSLKDYPALFEQNCDIPRLVALSDLGGGAWLTATFEDWLIPSGILGSVISGLTSRSLLTNDIDKELAESDCFNNDHWHRCVVFDELKDHDLSVEFIETILDSVRQHPTSDLAIICNTGREIQSKKCSATIDWIAQKYSVGNINLIKPSIAEATRAVLRRIPERILVKNINDPNIQLLLHFAKENDVEVEVLGDELGSYQAITIIKKLAG